MRDLARGYMQTRVFMDTPVVIEVSAPERPEADLAEYVDRAYGWFAEVERRCSRFDESSELRSLSRRHAGVPLAVSPILFNALHVSLMLAECSEARWTRPSARRWSAQASTRTMSRASA